MTRLSSTVELISEVTFTMRLLISLAADADVSARPFISSATTAKPRPASPALAASIEALSGSVFI